jgi:hypothetical protein
MLLRHTKLALCAVLFVALLYAIPAGVLYGIRTTDTSVPGLHGHDCSTNDKVKDTMFPTIYNGVLFLSFFIILIALTVIYIRFVLCVDKITSIQHVYVIHCDCVCVCVLGVGVGGKMCVC